MIIRRGNTGDVPGVNKLLEQVLQDDLRPVFVVADEANRVLGYAFCVFVQHLNNTILTDVKTRYEYVLEFARWQEWRLRCRRKK